MSADSPDNGCCPAQGGIAGVMAETDSMTAHARDTLVAGAGLADAAAVEVLVTEGPDRIRDLIDLGVAFDRSPDGTLLQGLEAAHSAPRILHAAPFPQDQLADALQALKDGEAWSDVVTAYTSEGQPLRLRATVMPALDAGGRTEAYVAVASLI